MIDYGTIDKFALVAEIERRKKELIELSNDFANQWACASLDNILSFLNALEAKEVDLEKEISFQWSKFCLNGKDRDSFVEVAKHFFELGMQQSKKPQ